MAKLTTNQREVQTHTQLGFVTFGLISTEAVNAAVTGEVYRLISLKRSNLNPTVY